MDRKCGPVIFVAVLFFFSFLSASAFCQACSPELKIFKIQHGSATELYDLVSNLKSPEGRVTFEQKTNTLVVFDCPEIISRINTIVQGLDIREKQVEVRVVVAEVSDEGLSQIGVRPGISVIPKEFLSAAMKLLRADKNSRIRSEMTLNTMSNYPAVIQVDREEMIGIDNVVLADGSTALTPIRESLGRSLEVLPSVGSDNTINLIVRPSVSTYEKGLALSEQRILTRAVVNSGDTMVIGGSGSGNEIVEKSRDALGAGKFRIDKNYKKGQMVMFLTARIME